MFRIGEFSKIAQTPISQLRYYDQIGLFQPVYTDKFTSYRYYSARQLPDLNRIIALKELDLSLEQIRRMIDDNVSEDEIRGMLALKKAQIEQSIHEEIARLRTVESRLRHITNDGEMKDFDVVVKSIPTQLYMSLRETLANVYDALNICHEMFRLLPAHVKEKDLGQFTAVLHDESFDIEDTDVELGFQLNRSLEKGIILSGGREMKVGELPAIPTAVTAVRLGLGATGINNHLTYGALGTWVESNGYRFDGPPREVLIVPPRPGREEEAVIEIQFPVTRQSEAADLALIT